MKSDFLSLLRNLAKRDVSNHPGFVFLKYLRSEIEYLRSEITNSSIPSDALVPILGSFQVEITQLGDDATPHDDFLKECAKLYAKIINNEYTVYAREFGHEAALMMIKRNLSIEF